MSEIHPAAFGTAAAQGRPLEVAVLVSPQVALIDIVPFHTAFAALPGVRSHLVWKNKDELVAGPDFPIRATTTFEECPADLDVLFAGAVPAEYFEDAETLEFLADRGGRAGWIAGVCAGALLMGAAGLLDGYRATTNFQMHHYLTAYGAIPERGNVVEDRDRITAGPATGSTEIGLRLAQVFFGDHAAKSLELLLEYAPRPLFGVGSPELAGPELTRSVREFLAAFDAPYQRVAERAAQRLGHQPASA